MIGTVQYGQERGTGRTAANGTGSLWIWKRRIQDEHDEPLTMVRGQDTNKIAQIERRESVEPRV